MSKNVTAIFDIGKTNKKFFLFDENYQEVYRSYTRFDEIVDEGGYPTEDLVALQKWLKDLFHTILESKKYNVKAINFSSYGASFVHIDEHGEVVAPLYNYMKPMDEDILASFYKKYGPEIEFSTQTGSPKSGMLNSGMQLYWLKYAQPEIFKKIKYSLHLPQYLSYIFTGIPLSEYTSIGCHTALWDYSKKDYHQWVYDEGIYHILAPIVCTETSINMNYNGEWMKIGVGIHDSSSALIPYVRGSHKPFILVSTGTWSVSLNPFSQLSLTQKDIEENTINYMRINGDKVKSAKLMLGNEYKYQVTQLSEHFELPYESHKNVKFDSVMFQRLEKDFKYCFHWKILQSTSMPKETSMSFKDYKEGYHQLMIELVHLQVKNITAARDGDSSIKRLFIDGGFSDNEIYIKLLSHYMRDMKLRSTSSSLGSALGAAIVISDSKLKSKFLKKNYALKKHIPFIIH